MTESKQARAKREQGYTRDKRDCGRCAHFMAEETWNEYGDVSLIKKRCSLGDFAVAVVSGTCDRWKQRKQA